MGLDVGVVKISYLERPSDPVYDFLWELAAGTCKENWGGGWEGNAFVELIRESMLSQMAEYVRIKNLSHDDSDKIKAWANSLPWDGDTIMLHLNW
jgi:hypothetical protein